MTDTVMPQGAAEAWMSALAAHQFVNERFPRQAFPESDQAELDEMGTNVR